MSAHTASAPRSSGPRGRSVGVFALAPILLGGTLGLARIAIEPQLLRFAFAGAIALLVVGLGLRAPRETLLALMIWLAALGFLRRVISGYAPASGNDPLLLVEPLMLAVLLVVAAGRGAFRRRTPLTNAVAILCLLVLIGAVNPLQGSLLAGVAGLLFILVPMLGFWIGRSICDDQTMTRVLKIAGVLAVIAAGYGLWQTFVGLPSWDFNWAWTAQSAGYNALVVYSAGGGGAVIRPFSMFSSASEYVAYLAIGIVVMLAFGMRSRRTLVVLATAAFMAAALLYGSSRGSVVGLVAGVVFMVGALRRHQLGLTVATAAAVLLLVPLIAGAALPTSANETQGSGTLIAHQLEGLRDPLDPKTSTVGFHAQIVIDGLKSAGSEPLGLGIGSVNIASFRFGGLERGTEADPSNLAVALGIPGLLTYLAVFVLGFRVAYRHALRRHDRLAIAALGVLCVTVFQWLTGGNYAVAIIPWLILGWLDRQSSEGHGKPRVLTFAPKTGSSTRAATAPARESFPYAAVRCRRTNRT